MSCKRFVISIASACLATTVFAEDFTFFTPDWTKVITLSMGPTWASPGETQTYYTPPGISPNYQYTQYLARETTETVTSGEVFFALQRPLTPWVTQRLGIAFAATTEADLHGTLALNLIPVASYRYKISHAHVALKGLFFACPDLWIQPYISGSFGYSFNASDSFKTNPPLNFYNYNNGNNGALTLLKFPASTKGSFAYTIGLGFQVKLAKNWEFGMGYELADWGRSQLKKSYFGEVFPPPKIGSVYAHQLQFSLSYLYCL
ncbi:hypothetical protein ACNVED_01890 [Legionella sp. D16C41]|uniref:hypothetical protein n=1 Tax=Legionella sp. D16C41 TaxID=3402688 RepID=UPI003AF5ADBA